MPTTGDRDTVFEMIRKRGQLLSGPDKPFEAIYEYVDAGSEQILWWCTYDTTTNALEQNPFAMYGSLVWSRQKPDENSVGLVEKVHKSREAVRKSLVVKYGGWPLEVHTFLGEMEQQHGVAFWLKRFGDAAVLDRVALRKQFEEWRNEYWTRHNVAEVSKDTGGD